jgi:hypothetical protein
MHIVYYFETVLICVSLQVEQFATQGSLQMFHTERLSVRHRGTIQVVNNR